MPRGASRAFTPIEMLPAVAMVDLLLALLLPVVLAAREAAQRIRCVCNQKMLGRALPLHHEAGGRFPYALGPRPLGAS